MYKKLDITENHLKVLSLFTRGFDREYYIREVQKQLNISPRTAQLVLEDLERKTILESKTRGKIRTYRVKKSDIAKEYLIFVEQYKKISFLEENQLIKEIVSKIGLNIKGICFIFGSYAKGTQKKDSDIDIFIVGLYNKQNISKISDLYGIKISIKKYPLRIFEKEMKKDILIKEVLCNHIIISGIEDFINIWMSKK